MLVMSFFRKYDIDKRWPKGHIARIQAWKKNIKNINRNSRSRKDTSSIYFNGTGPELVNADRTMGMSGK